MRISELGRFYPEGRKNTRTKESPETEKNEVSVTLEQAEKKITTAEVVVGVIALGLRAKLFMDDKGTEARGVIEKAKKIFKPNQMNLNRYSVLLRCVLDHYSLTT